MKLVEESTVPNEVLPLEAFKAHLRLGSGFETETLQDSILASFLRAAITAIEARTSKVLIERKFSLQLVKWRGLDSHVLPVAPVTRILRVFLIKADGAEIDLDPESYWLQQDEHSPRLRAKTRFFPPIPESGMAVIQFEAGYGQAWADMPSDLHQAVMLLGAHYYEFRNETKLSAGCTPFGVSSLIERYRLMRIFGGGL